MTPIRVAVAGCGGKMGRAIVRLAAQDASLRLVAGVTFAGDPLVGSDIGVLAGVPALGIAAAERCETIPDVMIEFTGLEGCRQWAAWCGEQGVALVSGTTGIGAVERTLLEDVSRRAAVLWSPNMSVGVNLLLRLVEQTAAALGPEWDIEIVESHHRQKVDAPSGTARALLEAACRGRGAAPADAAVFGRSGETGPRPTGQIGVHALRLGGVVGEHDVHFALPGEVLTLRHRAESRDTFAAGALRAARWLAGRPAGLYAMRDVLA